MSRRHIPQRYFRRAYVDDSKTFSRYAPIAERILCLAEQTDAVTENQLNILRQYVAGTTGPNIERIHKPEGTATAILSRYYLRALEHLSHFDKPLVSRFLAIRNRRTPESFKREWIERYRSKPEVKIHYKISSSEYYDAHKKEINRQRRKRWKQQSSDPEVLKTRRKYGSRPDVLAKARERMRILRIKHRKKFRAKCKHHCGKPRYRAWRKRFLHSERYLERMKVRQKIYKECGALLTQLNDMEHPGLRYDAAMALGSRARDYMGASAILIGKLSDPDESVREAVAWALGERREWKATQKLVSMAKSASVEGRDSTLVGLIKALWKIGTPDSLAAVKRYTTHSDTTVRETAISLIRRPPFFIMCGKKRRA